MPDAFMPVDDHSFTTYQREYVTFGADTDTTSATYAGIHVDMRVLGAWPIGEDRSAIRSLLRRSVIALMRPPVSEDKEPEYDCADEPGEKSVHGLAKPQPHESQPHDNCDVDNCQHRERIAERAVDHMPEVEDAMGMIQERDSSR